ncbi:sulfur carrier protein ThiS [Thalassotalea euphylliae]|uniref:Sulfur carrier protein ThiS n=1 Tax=Thalassotalea euphylliae TaxID=1655234 RepID=A0A3E0UKG1_9GAMM|nr:sulfur carrier protein ThiS [Thalassotalea euphylliae]REL37113.1 sulfur carrier protein ThiS [Thalassotalea euphylliae]
MTHTYPDKTYLAHTYLVNGKAFTLDQAVYQEAEHKETDITVSQLLNEYFSVHPEPKLFAVAVDQTFVAKTDYETTSLSNGASIELFSPIQGG